VRIRGKEGGIEKSVPIDTIAAKFRKLILRLKLTNGRGFYALRHTFQTVAEDSLDFPAVKHVMGHKDQSISRKYREQISDDRLKAVTEVVRQWLWPELPEVESTADKAISSSSPSIIVEFDDGQGGESQDVFLTGSRVVGSSARWKRKAAIPQ
jgi:hypothetical protein